jgi:hypothetical protein
MPWSSHDPSLVPLVRRLRFFPRGSQEARSAFSRSGGWTATRRALGQQAARGRQRHGEAGRKLSERSREQIYEVARKMGISGRSKMGKRELIDAIRKAR